MMVNRKKVAVKLDVLNANRAWKRLAYSKLQWLENQYECTKQQSTNYRHQLKLDFVNKNKKILAFWRCLRSLLNCPFTHIQQFASNFFFSISECNFRRFHRVAAKWFRILAAGRNRIVSGQDRKLPPASETNRIAGFIEFCPLTNWEKKKDNVL